MKQRNTTDTSESTSEQESLSALMDDALSSADSGFTLRQLDADSELKQKWARYHMIAAATRQDSCIAPLNFAEQIMQAVENEPQDTVEAAIDKNSTAAAGTIKSAWYSQWFKPAAAFTAVAAVAVVSVLTISGNEGASVNSAPAPLASVDGQTSALATETLASSSNTEDGHPLALAAINQAEKQQSSEPVAEWTLAAPEAQTRLNAYLINHAEYGSIGAGRGMMQYARLVGQGQNMPGSGMTVGYTSQQAGTP